jgi:hypothetical protein
MAVPFQVVFLADHRDLPDGRAQVGDRHLKFYEPRDNLPLTGQEPPGSTLDDRPLFIESAVYTVDCPCLEGDTNAIKELVGRNYHLIGGATSIRVRRVERVNSRLWLVIADFDSAPLRIETETGDLVRQEPAGSDLFQFALAKPVDATEWLLGRASAYKDG